MNNLKEMREIAGLSQKELAALIQDVEPRIDVGMISRFETGVCLPTPIVARTLAKCLSTSVRNLFGKEGQTYIYEVNAEETPVEPLPFVVEELVNELTEWPRSRRDLCEALDMNDRQLRKLIAEARSYGYVIVNHGDGYYKTTDENEMAGFYRTEYSRAMSILKGLSPLKKYLKTMGVKV